MARPTLIVFSDLDGTLLDAETYDFQAALPAINELNDRHIPLIFCSSKTRTEIEYFRGQLGNTHPFIVENGGAIYVPHTLNEPLSSLGEKGEGSMINSKNQAKPCNFLEDFAGAKERDGYYVIEFGRPYQELRRALRTISRRVGHELKGFGDMSVEEISQLTGLSIGEATLASQREYDEPFLLPDSEEITAKIIANASDLGLAVLQGGTFAHLIGGTDKGRACQVLINWYRRQKGSVITAAFGDSLNDLAMLATVDYPFLVEMKGGGHHQDITLHRLVKLKGEGPSVWSTGIWQLLESFMHCQ